MAEGSKVPFVNRQQYPTPGTEPLAAPILPIHPDTGGVMVHNTVPKTGTTTPVTLVAATAKEVLRLNPGRRRFILWNASGAALYVAFGERCDTGVYSFQLADGIGYESLLDAYAGPVTCYSAAGGAVKVTEIA